MVKPKSGDDPNRGYVRMLVLGSAVEALALVEIKGVHVDIISYQT